MTKRIGKSHKARNPHQRTATTAREAEKTVSPETPDKFGRRKWLWLVGGLLALLLVAGAVLAARNGGFGTFAAKRTLRPVGNVTSCQKIPAFVQTQNFSKNAVLSTSEKARPGLWLVERSQTGEMRRFQHPSWKDAGFLAPITRDVDGNVFVAPAPVINTLLNPIENQNTVYRIDGKTGEMKPLTNLPPAAKSNEQNPFGALGLTFDCDTDSLYVSSVYGSSRQTEAGRIHRINHKTGAVTTQPLNFDVIGLSVFNAVGGKRLYYGLARASEIWSIALDDNGDVVGEPRLEISLAGAGPRGDDKARRITFTANREMLVYGIEFSFNLVAPTEKQETLYRFGYDMKTDRWQMLEFSGSQVSIN